jgi:nitrate/nitrite transport system permease protein
MSGRFDPFAYLLPLIGIGLVLLVWSVLSYTVAPDLPSPLKTWEESKDYVLRPFFKDGEMNQGIARFALLSLVRVAKGFLVAIAAGTLLGYLLGLSVSFYQAFDPVIQVLRPISPLAWLPLGLVIFRQSEPAAVFTIAICAMWPTVINTAVGVRNIPQDYLNVGRVLRLSRAKMLRKVIIPATLPYIFTGWRLSLGIAWLVIVASEMLTGAPGIGGFLWQEYNSLVYSHILLSIITIGLIGFLLDRLMGVVERRFRVV